ncbi:MAG: rhodanese-like domain-containing protein [Meiothermus sp.]|nr:rhodanese-like domain-containing protein [Meiothermus sp.]
MELWHDAFYRFVRLEDLPTLRAELLERCQSAGLLGTVLLAPEGINGMLAGTEAQLGKVRDWLEADPRFTAMLYKRTACRTRPFSRLKVKIKREIVPLGLEGVDATRKTGINLSPAQWREWIRRDDVVLIDNRNSFEFGHGHFKGAIDPQVGKFRSFAAYFDQHKAEWEGKKVAMYCTGGIRCEKTTAWLAEQGLEVYQLEGGILNYFAQIPDAEADYEGDCFVFDDRVLLDTRLEEKNRPQGAGLTPSDP